MPTSFSRVLSEQELEAVRNQYLEALANLDDEEEAESGGEPGTDVERAGEEQT